MPGTHGAYVDRLQKDKAVDSKSEISSFMHLTQSEIFVVHKNLSRDRATVAESRFHRTSLALGNETLVMKMVSCKFYWLDETMSKLYGEITKVMEWLT
jgi:hypothetical protein